MKGCELLIRLSSIFAGSLQAGSHGGSAAIEPGYIVSYLKKRP